MELEGMRDLAHHLGYIHLSRNSHMVWIEEVFYLWVWIWFNNSAHQRPSPVIMLLKRGFEGKQPAQTLIKMQEHTWKMCNLYRWLSKENKALINGKTFDLKCCRHHRFNSLKGSKVLKWHNLSEKLLRKVSTARM